jgi:GDP-L-fucose synthase
MVGSAIQRKLVKEGYQHLITRSSGELDLRNPNDVDLFFQEVQPEYIFLAAAKVGGIQANNRFRADFLHDNLAIELNVIHAAYRYGVKKLLFLGSSCIYPKNAPIPLKEEYLLTGSLEMTNEPYAIAKIAGIKLCEAYRDQYGCNFVSVMPTNLYGPNDNYDLENSHVLPALIRKFHEAKMSHAPFVSIWGSGKPLREFLHADDLAEACFFVMNQYNEKQFLNVGFGADISILELANLVGEITGFEGAIVLDESKPDGTYRKLMDCTRINALGWNAKISLREGLSSTYTDFLNTYSVAVNR